MRLRACITRSTSSRPVPRPATCAALHRARCSTSMPVTRPSPAVRVLLKPIPPEICARAQMYALVQMPAPQYAPGPYMQIEHHAAPPSAKPPRWNIKKSHLEVLESAFERDHFPPIDVRHAISEELGVSNRQVQVWFQNRRQRARAVERATEVDEERQEQVSLVPSAIASFSGSFACSIPVERRSSVRSSRLSARPRPSSSSSSATRRARRRSLRRS